jgi:pumilio homology domain family member 6
MVHIPSYRLTPAQKLFEAKKIWESLRLQKQDKSERQQQVNELFTLIKGDIPNLVFGHSASRFVQAAMKYGTKEQRREIAKELEGRYIELSKAKYGKFLVGKVLEYGYSMLK